MEKGANKLPYFIMGIFSKKKKVKVGVTAVKMVEKVANPYQQAILSSVFGKRSINDVFMSEMKSNFYTKTETYYRYGKNKYVNGLPEGYKNYSNINLSAVATVLGKILAQPVVVNFAKVSFADEKYFAYRHLQETIRLNPTNNLIGSAPVIYPPNTIVTAVSITLNEATHTATVSAEVQKPAPTANDPVPPKEYPVWNIVYPVDTENTFLQVKYRLSSDTGTVDYRYWFYNVLGNTYPELDTVIRDGFTSPFYPLIPIRQNKVNVIDVDNELRTNVERMTYILGIKLNSITDAIMNTSNGNTPENIDECFIGFFANLHEPAEATKFYLYEFFKDLYNKQKVTKTIFTNWYNNKGSRDTPQESLTIAEKDFNIRLLWNYIDKVNKTENIGSVGKVEISTTTNPRFILGDFDFEESKLVLKKQITTTTIEELTIHGLEHLVDVYEGKMHNTTIADLSNDDFKYGFYIPLQRDIIKKMPFVYKNQLMQDSLHMVLYSVQITYVKWYQRGFFKTLITIAAVVIAVYFGDWSTAFSGGITWSTAVTLATNIIINMILIEGAKIVIKEIGGELALILATAIAIYALSTGKLGLEEPTFADDLLKTSLATYEANNQLVVDEIAEITREMENLLQSVKERKEEIKEAYDLLGSKSIDYFDIRKNGMMFNPNETADDFYNRTVYNSNPGVQCYNVLYYFYENALKLKPSSM